ncbi:MAG: class I SAM-dependent RNA methyltransferase [Lachnospiraceae bacterium]|nr:class I SAM-dependent RNA methyltransferase [Lachnospiraceae bacterium]
MERFTFVCPCHFGLESVLKREIYELGYETTLVQDGRVCFEGDAEAICRANIGLRTAERVLLQVGSFHAATFDELFEGVKALPLEHFLPKDASFPITKASSVKSALFSPSDIQSIVKRAAVERLKSVYHLTWFPESGAHFPIRVFLHKDIAEITIDTTGDSLHKRGYRKLASLAPISENLAAGILLLSRWKGKEPLVDPFCGSGTIPIEAAMIAQNIAPGKARSFTAQAWETLIPKKLWADAKEEAIEQEDASLSLDIQGFDNDANILGIARNNAKLAGVEGSIHFQRRDISELSHKGQAGCIVTNPPYGERLPQEDIFEIYRTLGERFKTLEGWSMHVISAFKQAESAIGMKATKNRKLYNGMIKTYLYQYMRPKKSSTRNI